MTDQAEQLYDIARRLQAGGRPTPVDFERIARAVDGNPSLAATGQRLSSGRKPSPLDWGSLAKEAVRMVQSRNPDASRVRVTDCGPACADGHSSTGWCWKNQ